MSKCKSPFCMNDRLLFEYYCQAHVKKHLTDALLPSEHETSKQTSPTSSGITRDDKQRNLYNHIEYMLIGLQARNSSSDQAMQEVLDDVIETIDQALQSQREQYIAHIEKKKQHCICDRSDESCTSCVAVDARNNVLDQVRQIIEGKQL